MNYFFPCFAKKIKYYDRVAGVAITLIHSFSISVRSESAVRSEWFSVKTWPFLTIFSANRLLWTRPQRLDRKLSTTVSRFQSKTMSKFIFRVFPNATSEDHKICFDLRRFHFNLSIQFFLS